MKIIVVSDTHRDRRFVSVLTEKYPDAERYLHAGDSELSPAAIYPFETVRGNCDYGFVNPILLTSVDGVRILMFHGHDRMLELQHLTAIGKKQNAEVVIHGHTHRPYYKCKEGIHVLCPGSITYPALGQPTYAVITILSGKVIKTEIKDYEDGQ